MKHNRLLPGMLLTLLVVVLMGGAWLRLTAPPTVQVSPQTLPPQNAYDGYIAATRAVVDADKVDAFAESTPAERRALLAKNACALRLLRQSLPLPYCEPRPANIYVTRNGYAEFHSLACLLALEASVYGDRGEWCSAAQSGLDAVEMGGNIPRGAPVTGALIGHYCQGVGRESIREALSRLRPAEARVAAARLQAISAAEVPFADAVGEQKYLAQMLLLDHLPAVPFIARVLPGSGVQTKGVPWPISRRRSMANLVLYMDQIAANSRRPYASRLAAPAVPLDPMLQSVVPYLPRGWFLFVRNQADTALLLAELGLQAYRAEHGQYPGLLNELVPIYLQAIPLDPFALKGPVRYRRVEAHYVLYSIGPDGRDDGGKPIHDPGSQGRRATRVEETSMGDMVAGVNW